MTENENKKSGPAPIDKNGLARLVNERLTEFKASFYGHPLFPDLAYLVELTRDLLSEKAMLNYAVKKLAATAAGLDDLRIYITYQTFDLEASRRENAALKKLLSEHGIDPNKAQKS